MKNEFETRRGFQGCRCCPYLISSYFHSLQEEHIARHPPVFEEPDGFCRGGNDRGMPLSLDWTIAYSFDNVGRKETTTSRVDSGQACPNLQTLSKGLEGNYHHLQESLQVIRRLRIYLLCQGIRFTLRTRRQRKLGNVQLQSDLQQPHQKDNHGAQTQCHQAAHHG